MGLLPVIERLFIRSTCGLLHRLKHRPVRELATTTNGESVLVWAQDPGHVALQMKTAVEQRKLDEACMLYDKLSPMEGFPRKSLLGSLICGLAESYEKKWLLKASSLVEQAFDQNRRDILDRNSLIYLSYVLSRCELSIPASTLLRKLIEIEEFIPVSIWVSIISYFSNTKEGAFLAAELVCEIGHLFKDNRVDPRKKSNRPLLGMKPNPMAFSIALIGCLVFGVTRKAEQLLELMPRVGVKPDTELLIIMAHVFERNGRLGEIKKLQRHIDEVCEGLTDSQYQQWYSCLLSCHLKLGELTSACDIVLGMLKRANKVKNSLAAARSVLEAVQGRRRTLLIPPAREEKKFNFINSQLPSFVEFTKDIKFLRFESDLKAMLCRLSEKLHAQVELVRSEGGILHPSEKVYAKLVMGFIEKGKISDLAGFLVKVSREERSVVAQVLDSCIGLGLLEPAHDLLDEMRFHGIRVSSSVYSSLLKAYCKEGRVEDATALLKDAKKGGLQIDSNCYELMMKERVLRNDMDSALSLFKEMKESGLPLNRQSKVVQGTVDEKESFMARLLEEVNGNGPVDCGVHDWNNVVDFFCKKRMMHDAQKAFKKMKINGRAPNAQTFHSLVNGYAAIGGRYAEVTDLWGEMKALNASKSTVEFDQELLDSVLYCFVRGGFFLRANEVVEMMERGKMFIDKYKYRSLWLKYHRKLYKGKAAKIQTEVQFERREAALAFKSWLGIS
ncbi:pentatricopeptide repeat (PPR) superfamily protein [Wolffia australiana]